MIIVFKNLHISNCFTILIVFENCVNYVFKTSNLYLQLYSTCHFFPRIYIYCRRTTTSIDTRQLCKYCVPHRDVETSCSTQSFQERIKIKRLTRPGWIEELFTIIALRKVWWQRDAPTARPLSECSGCELDWRGNGVMNVMVGRLIARRVT